ncbi:YIP1 family protein [Parashewanella tropica]|uniref:YIP1 family protein n=1 Tax=Parashewanella tropica TaxID=2547970 RepID=UPI001478F7EF|nr:YIP1 family protein [Parashewanella tropica]
MKSATVFGAITDIYLSPTKAFNGLKEAKGWSWTAFAFIFGSMLVAMSLFYASADPQYLIDQQIAALPNDMTAQERDGAIKGIEMVSGMMQWFAIGGGAVAIVVFTAIFALYFLLISKLDPENNQSFGDWFAFNLWVQMPALFNWIGVIILVAIAGTDQLSLTIFNFASLNQLVLGLDMQSPFYGLTENITIFALWGVALSVLGLKSWTNFSTSKAILFGALPSVLIWGIWFIIAAL